MSDSKEEVADKMKPEHEPPTPSQAVIAKTKSNIRF